MLHKLKTNEIDEKIYALSKDIDTIRKNSMEIPREIINKLPYYPTVPLLGIYIQKNWN